MRLAITLLAGLALAWAGAWLVAARVVERAAETWLAEQAAAGRLADHEAVSVGGFPGRLDLTVEGLRLGDPWGVVWEVPQVALALGAGRPDRVRAGLEGRQRLIMGAQALEVEADRLEGAVRVGGRELALREGALQVEALRLEAGGGPGTLGLRTLGLETAAEAGAEERQRLRLGLRDLVLAGPDGRPLAPLERLDLTATVLFDAPLDRHAAVRGVQPQELVLEALSLVWAGAEVQAGGRLEIGADGFPEGRIGVEVAGWRPLLDMAVTLDLLRPELAPTWERVLETLEAAGDRPGVLPLALVFSRGRVSLGPLPLGPAPRLRL